MKTKKSKFVRRDEFEELKAIVEELAIGQKELQKGQKELQEGQKELQEGQKELQERQKELQQRQKELQEGYKRLEKGLDELRVIVENLAKQVGVLTDARGYGLEAITTVTLPSYLLTKYKIKINTLGRKFIEIDGKEIEINLFAKGKKGKKIIPVLVECKATIYEADVKNFYNKKIKPINEKLWKETINVMTGYLIHPSGYKAAKKLNIIVVAPVVHYY